MNAVERNKFNFQCQQYVNMAAMGNSDDRNHALLELEKLLINTRVARQLEEQKEKERLTAEERVWGDRIHSVAEIESYLEAFLTDRKFYRDRCTSGNIFVGNNQSDRDFSHQFRNFLRRCLKLPTL